ncbi:MAG: hypothetical protein HZB72_01880 [Burkholderiales bacterium]|nr:hypothetical protein [Burkholderiales bacterium]
MGLLDLLGLRAAQGKDTNTGASAAPACPAAAVAQLVGANWVSCMFDPGYAMEKYITPLYDLGPEGQPPKAFKSLTGSAGDQTSRVSHIGFERKYLVELTQALSFLVTYYNREAEGFHMFMWNGVKMNGLPVIANFIPDRTEEEARKIWRSAYLAYGDTSLPALTVVSGNSGWTALETALKALPTPDSKVLWLTSVDLPSFPKAQQPNEASTVLMLGHPGTDTGRRPLVYYTAPVVVPVKDVKRRREEKPRVAALRQAVEQACAAAGLKPQDIGKVVTDAGRHTPPASARLGELGGALADLMPDFDVLKDRIDFAALLGDLGANTVNLSLLVGAYAAYRHNVPVLYVSTVDPDAGRAMLILPPAGHVPPDPYRKFKEHLNIGQWYAPWWGPRLDGRKDYSAATQ